MSSDVAEPHEHYTSPDCLSISIGRFPAARRQSAVRTARAVPLRLVHNMTHTLALRCGTVRRHAVRYTAFPAVAYFPFTNFRCSAGTVMTTGKWRRTFPHIQYSPLRSRGPVRFAADLPQTEVATHCLYSFRRHLCQFCAKNHVLICQPQRKRTQG